MATKFVILALVALMPSVAVAEQDASEGAANPIRKVVTMLQMMQKKVSAEGEQEKDLYKKFMCYCRTGGSDLSASISAAEGKVPQVGTDIEEAESKKASTEEALKAAKADRAAAETAMKEATAIREKEAAAFAAEKAEADSNIFAILGKCTKQKPGGEWGQGECSKVGGEWVGALHAIQQGMAGAFLQTGAANVLKQLALGKQDSMTDGDRKEILAFLSGDSSYAPQSAEIVGILKQLAESMQAGLASATSEEEAALKSYDELMAAKTKEANALTASIESKTKMIGELAVKIVEMKNDLSETQAALLEDQKFLADLDKGCATKTAEWEERSKTRAEELVALAETIKVLNDDDALDLFKATLPSASASLMQVNSRSLTAQKKVLAMIRKEQLKSHNKPIRARLDLLALALSGKKAASTGGFEKVVKMIDDMVAMLKQEQSDDDHKKEYCAVQFDHTDDKKKSLERSASQLETAIANGQEGIATLKDELAALSAGIVALDKSVAEATEQRREENKAFTELMASDSAAKELLGIAKNRLNKFYNPKLYKAAPKAELSAQDRILVNNGGTATPTPAPGGIAGTGVTVLSEVSVHNQGSVAPPPPPATWGAYGKKSGESTGVIAMIDLLIKDLAKEMTEAKTAENDAQEDYEKMTQDSAQKRVQDSEAVASKEASKANLEADLENNKGEKTRTDKELMATMEYIQSLHAECDWLLQYFETRKEARAGEVDSLNNAKAVLSGADYSLLQVPQGFLRGAH